VHSATVYLLLGDWFGWLACALLVFAVLQLCRLSLVAESRGQNRAAVRTGGTGRASA
jgi:hypothetical protein